MEWYDSRLFTDQSTSTEFHLSNIGIAVPGPLDTKTGLLLSPPNLQGWDDVDLVTPLSTAFDLPVSLENDANAGLSVKRYTVRDVTHHLSTM